MNWRIAVMGEDPVLSFAAQELSRCIKAMSGASGILCMRKAAYQAEQGVLYLGCEAFAGELPAVADPGLDDGIYVHVDHGTGVIAGTNARSVLIGVYRFLHVCGCRWVRPGADGEYIPRGDASGWIVHIREAASYRHRGLCIEGSNSFEHIAEIIAWLPKVGMNSYFNQFLVPFTFFDRWYSHKNNPHKTPEPVSVEDVRGMTAMLVDEIKKRGLLYHAVGHSWTCEPFGIEGSSWDTKDYFVSEEAAKTLAQVNGKRELWGGIPLNTNLCYSQDCVRGRITDAIREYCLAHPSVDFLHFWLADGSNNHCECEGCRDTLPADYYVRMLNELDDKLTDAGITTKIVFLIYVDLLWEPKTDIIQNPDRFVLMFAPITRTYSSAFTDGLAETEPELAPYVRNRLTMPRSVTENVARLRRWQQQFSGDSFDFDYHLMWDHYGDQGYTTASRVLFRDMQNLDKLGLNGMISCQTQRVFLPTGLPVYAMARALWDKNADFDAVESEYFTSTFGSRSGQAAEYLHGLTRLFDPVALRGERPLDALKYEAIPGYVHAFLPQIEEAAALEADPVQKQSWDYLRTHAMLCIRLGAMLSAAARGNLALRDILWQQVIEFLSENENKLSMVFDMFEFISTMNRVMHKLENNKPVSVL